LQEGDPSVFFIGLSSYSEEVIDNDRFFTELGLVDLEAKARELDRVSGFLSKDLFITDEDRKGEPGN
jgi:hypothetical protein